MGTSLMQQDGGYQSLLAAILPNESQMKPRKKRQQYKSSYPCPRYSKPFYERFSSYEEANLRIAQIEYEKSLGVFQPPTPIPTPVRSMQQKSITVGELMDKYVQVYSMNHRGDSFLSCSKHRIEHYQALSWECSREGTDHS